MAKKKITNPLTPFGWFLTFGFFIFFVGSLLADQQKLLSIAMPPLIFFCALYFTIWIVFQYRTGEISVTSKTGMTHRCTRKKDKILFFIYVGMGFAIGLSLTILVGSDVLLGCEWSLINSCSASLSAISK